MPQPKPIAKNNMVIGQKYEITYTVDAVTWKMTALYLGGNRDGAHDFSLRPSAGNAKIADKNIASVRPVARTAAIVLPKRVPKVGVKKVEVTT